MFCWRVLAFRLTLLGLFLATCWITARGWSPLAVRQAVKRSFGQVLDFDVCQIDWKNGQLDLANVAIPDSEDPLRNLVQGTALRAKVDPQSLWRSEWVFEQVEVQNIALGTPRDKLASDQFNGVGNSWRSVVSESAQYDLAAAAKRWLDQVQTGPPIHFQDSDEFGALSAEIRKAWQSEFESRRLELSRLHQDMESTMSQLGFDNPNPLRSADRNRQLQAKLNELRERLTEIREWLNDWQDSHAAAVERLREVRIASRKAPQPVSLGPGVAEAAAGLLISETDLDTSRRILAWVNEIQRRILDVGELSSRSDRRGRDVLLPGMSPRPTVFIKELAFEGACHLEGERTQFQGFCKNLSNRPELIENPIEFHLKGQGLEHFHIDGFVDRRGSVPLTEFRFSWLPVEARQTELGTANSVLISLTPHRSQTDATIRIQGDKLEGTITCFHTQAGLLVAALNEVSGGQEVLGKLNGQLGTIQQVEVVANVSGTLDHPVLTFSSDLAEPFTSALASCINLQLEEIQTRNQLTLDRDFDSTLEVLRELAARELRNFEEVMESQQLRMTELEKFLPDGSIRQIR